MKIIQLAFLVCIAALTSAASLNDYDTTISGESLDGRYIHFQSLRYPERWVRGWYSSTNKLKIKTYTERETYDEPVTQWKVKHLGSNVLVFEFMRRPSRYIRIQDNQNTLERSETSFPDDKDWAKWKILCTDSTMNDCIIQSQLHPNKYFDVDNSKKLQGSSFADPRSRFRILAPYPSDSYKTIWSTENAGSVDQIKSLSMSEGISETVSTSHTISVSESAEVSAAFGTVSATISYEWSTTSTSTWETYTTIQYQITVPAGKKIEVKQLIGIYGPFSVRSAHFYIEETDATTGKKREVSKKDPTVRKLNTEEKLKALESLKDEIEEDLKILRAKK